MRNDLHEANRLSWDAATVAHNSHKGDQAAFFRAGGSTLYPEELDLLGEIAGLEVGFERMRDLGGRRMVPPESMPSLPLMYAIAAAKPEPNL